MHLQCIPFDGPDSNDCCGHILVCKWREDILNDAAVLTTAENTALYTIHYTV